MNQWNLQIGQPLLYYINWAAKDDSYLIPRIAWGPTYVTQIVHKACMMCTSRYSYIHMDRSKSPSKHTKVFISTIYPSAIFQWTMEGQDIIPNVRVHIDWWQEHQMKNTSTPGRSFNQNPDRSETVGLKLMIKQKIYALIKINFMLGIVKHIGHYTTAMGLHPTCMCTYLHGTLRYEHELFVYLANNNYYTELLTLCIWPSLDYSYTVTYKYTII